MSEIQGIQQQIIREFGALDDWTERYKYIIEQGRELDKLDEKYKVDENLVRGCQSQVWLHSRMENGKIIFKADSDAAITKGLVSLMVRFYSGQTPDDILAYNPQFIKKIGMQEHLSPTRSNGLAAMIKQMKIYAMAYKTKMSKEDAD